MGSRTSRSLPLLAAGAALLAACTNAPPPPIVTSSPAPTSPPSAADNAQIVVGMDDITGGYNPHALADQSTVTTALSALLLPSVFRPAPDGTLAVDRTLMSSAEVSKTEPYTVTYRIRRDAAWSDGAPVAAEDFSYLREQMRDQPGTVDAAGYRLISNIASADGGKVVEVTFIKPYPGWRSLFGSLLPAHLLKDAPGGWESVLDESFPATAGPFAIKTLDRDRGEIQLERNDRYWEQPAVIDRLVLRRTDAPGLADALRSGHEQLAITRTDAVGVKQLQDIGDAVTVRTAARPTVVSLLFRPVGQDMFERGVRGALAAMLDRGALIDAATRHGPEAQLRVDSLVRAPAEIGYTPTIPEDAPAARQDLQLAERMLTEAGYVHTSGAWMREGRPLSVVVAAPAGEEPLATVAEEVRRQLTSAGVQARVVSPDAEQLFTQLLVDPLGQDPIRADGGAVNIAVASLPAGANSASVLATNFGCSPDLVDGIRARPGNPAGFCDSTVQSTIDAALTGAMTLDDALATIEPELWRQAVVIPLYQAADTLVVRKEVSGVDMRSPLSGPFGAAVLWRREALR